MIILVHTSKTMRPPAENTHISMTEPLLLGQAVELAQYMKKLTVSDIKQVMHVSEKLAETTCELFEGWTTTASRQWAAVDSFLGDIYSGMQVSNWTENDRIYANDHLRILSGLYGILRPLDGIYPYRLEMGYKLPDKKYKNLYTFWGDVIAKTLAKDEPIVDVSAVEYGKTVTNFIDPERVVIPRFLTINPKTHEPTFVVVHAKIARGAFASWMIRHQIEDVSQLKEFNEIGYQYDAKLSTSKIPVFICQEFGGIGLSVRLT